MTHTVSDRNKRARYISDTLADTADRWFSRESEGATIDLSAISELSVVAYEAYDSLYGACTESCHVDEREQVIAVLNGIWRKYDLPVIVLDVIVQHLRVPLEAD